MCSLWVQLATSNGTMFEVRESAAQTMLFWVAADVNVLYQGDHLFTTFSYMNNG